MISENFHKFLNSFQYFLKDKHSIDSEVKENSDNNVIVDLTQDGEDFYIGTYADPGALIEWIVPVKVGNADENLIRINGIVISAHGRSVAAWVNGYA